MKHCFQQFEIFLYAGVLCSTEEGETDHFPAHVSSYCDADDLMGMHQVLPWGAWHLHRSHKLICSYHHVFLLHDVCHGATVPEVSLVEEAHHDPADGITINP